MWVVTRNTPYYNHVKEFSSLQEARDYAQQMVEDYKEYCYSESFKICIAEVIEEIIFTPAEDD